MAGLSVSRREIKSFTGEKSIYVDLGQSWKLFDNNNLDKTIILYNGVLSLGGSSKNPKAERINWIELEDGAYQLKTESDFLEAEHRTGIPSWRLLDITNKYPDIKAVGR